MDFKKKRLNKALEDKTYRVKLVHGKKGWLAVGLTFITLFSATMLSQKTVDASAVNNVAVANSTTSSSVQLYNSVTDSSMHKANRGLANGTAWKTAKAVKGVDGQTYLLVGGNEYANANQMDLADETSSQDLSGVVRTNANKAITRLYTNPLADGGAQLITNRGLARDTAWKTDTKVVVNGQTYYRVATNEWVKADDAYLTSESSRSDKTYTNNAPDAEVTPDTNGNNSSSNSGSGSTTTPTDPDKEVTITVNYFLRGTADDPDNGKVLKSETVKVKLNSKYTVHAPEISGYKVVDGEDGVQYPVKFDGEVFNVAYVRDGSTTTPTDPDKEVTIKVNYFLRGTADDPDNGKVLKSETVKVALNSTYTVHAPAIEGFKVVPEENNVQYPVKFDGEVFNVAYVRDGSTTPEVNKANVTVNYVDSEGKVLQESKTLTDQEVGSSISETAPTIAGYTVDEATKTVTVAKDNNVITFTYTKDAVAPTTATVTVKYVDESGKEIADATTATAEVGKDFTAKAIDVDGYTVKGDATQTATVEGDKTVTFTYTKDAEPVQNSTITTKFVDKDGKELAKSTSETVKNGDPYTAKAVDVDGYTLDGDATQTIDSVKGDATLTFTYTKDAPVVEKANVTVNYVDSEGKALQDAKTLTDQEVGKDVTETAPEIDGYTVDKATQTLTVAKDNNVITFTYTKNAPVSLDTTEVANKIISLVNEYRQQNGLSALNTDANLTAGAVARANTEAGHVNSTGDINSANHDEFVAQTQPNLVQYGSTNMAENLAINGGSTADELAQTLVDQWKKSPDHNATMLDKSMTDIGVGVKQLDNGQYVAIQDFGGNAQSGITWDSSAFNTTTLDSVGVTKDQVSQQMATTYGLTLGTNYYVSDHIFKTKGDYESFMASSFETPDPLEGSIWDSVGASGKASTALIYDANGNAVGWGLALLEMDEPVQSYIDEGLSTWIK